MKRSIKFPLLAAVFLATFAATGEKATYTVVEGDSLWKISQGALHDPALWPTIWKANSFIENPNRIYPGEIISLPIECQLPVAVQPTVSPEEAKAAAASATAATDAAAAATKAALPPVEAIFSYTPKIIAASSGDGSLGRGDWHSSILKNQPPVFVGPSLPVAAIVLGSPTGATAIAPDMTVALDRGLTGGIAEGQRLWVVHPDRYLTHPATGKPVGWLYRTVAEVEINCATDTLSSGRIVTFFDAITPGDLCLTAVPDVGLGPDLTPAFRDTCAPANPTLTATLVAAVNDHDAIVIGERIVIDRGAENGLTPGDRLVAVQERVPGFGSERGIAVTAQPIGEIVVLTTMPRLATGILISATRELTSGASLLLLP
jgi:hypothetical protein